MNDLGESLKITVKQAVWEALDDFMKKVQTKEKYYPERMNHQQASEYIGMSKAYLYQCTTRNEIAVYKKGNRNFFKKSELDAWMESKRIKPVSEYKR
jgi:excisionase family DNA binding protein